MGDFDLHVFMPLCYEAEYYSALLEGPVKKTIRNKRKKGANISVISAG
jgi:hypothetical protein